MKVSVSKKKLTQIIVFSVLLVIFSSLFYLFWDFSPRNEWLHKGTIFDFRTNLFEANAVEIQPSCESLFIAYHNIYIRNLTIYFPKDVIDLQLYQLEAVELSLKLNTYNIINGQNIFIDAAQWNVPDGDPIGSIYHPRIYLIGPDLAEKNSVEFFDYTITISGRNLEEFDKATVKTMICLFGIDVN